MSELITPNGKIAIDCEPGQVSDGYHTFDELYEHRCLLFAALSCWVPGFFKTRLLLTPDAARAAPVERGVVYVRVEDAEVVTTVGGENG